MSMISFMLQERVKRIQGLFILCLTPHHHLTHAMRNKNKEKAKTLRKDDDNVDKKFFFNFYYPLSLFQCNKCSCNKKKSRKLKIEKSSQGNKTKFQISLAILQ